MTDRPATMTTQEVAEALPNVTPDRLPDGEDALTRLAWRPAWSIRSRQGAWGAFLAWIDGR